MSGAISPIDKVILVRHNSQQVGRPTTLMDIILYIETVHKDCHKEHGAVESVTDDEAHDTTP